MRLMAETVWPRGGWRRAASYVMHRLRRLPDAPQRIGRGVFAGIFITFTPFIGFQALLAVLLALAIRGNMVAALLATFIGNPLTYPFIMALSVEIGNTLLGTTQEVPLPQIAAVFARASVELWVNLRAFLGGGSVGWEGLTLFYRIAFLPWLVGGILPGLLCGAIGYRVSLPLIEAYRRHRRNQLLERAARKLAIRADVLEDEEARAWAEMQEAARAEPSEDDGRKE